MTAETVSVNLRNFPTYRLDLTILFTKILKQLMLYTNIIYKIVIGNNRLVIKRGI